MFPIITPQMFNMPDLVQAAAQARLPWPDGSVISARLMPTDVPGTALLILGSYRLLAQVPPTTPMGEVWMQLVNRQMPAKFALLSDMQALQVLAQMIEGNQTQAGRHLLKQQQSQKPVHAQAGQDSGDHSDWPHLNNPQRSDGKSPLPLIGEATADGSAMTWYDKKDEQPRAMLHRHIDKQHFSLSGRIDLDRLGGIAFTLQGDVPSAEGDGRIPWRLRVHAARDENIKHLRADFEAWLKERDAQQPEIDAEVAPGMPDNGPGGLTEFTV